MSRGERARWTVDWPGPGAPKVRDRIARATPTGRYSWAVVLAVRQVRTTKPLEPGYTGRYRIDVRVSDTPHRRDSDWTLYCYKRPPRRRTEPRPGDRWDPLL